METATTRRPVDAHQMRLSRAVGDGPEDPGNWIFEGYASVTNIGYEMYGGPPYGWTEIVNGGAFRKTLSEKPDVIFRVNHAGLQLARTTSGTLALNEDNIGLFNRADMEPTDPDVMALVPKVQRGDVNEMSFAFKITRQRWEELDGEEGDSMTAPVRRILEVSLERGDVSIVSYGANPHTAGATMRGLNDAFRALRSGNVSLEHRHLILVAMGDIDIEDSWVTDQGTTSWNEGPETETETEPAEQQQNSAGYPLSLALAESDLL